VSELRSSLPPWIEAYVADFVPLLRIIERTPGFAVQPVVVPSPDLARALADWLTAQEVVVRVIDLRHEPWDDLAARLSSMSFDGAGEDVLKAVVVITPFELEPEVFRRGLAAFNFHRDSIAAALRCPLLWCGSAELLRTTADHATDVWSIAGIPHRIPPRRVSEAAGSDWWTGAVELEAQELAARLASARARGDSVDEAREGLRLAEAQLARGDRTDAILTLDELSAAIRRGAGAFFLRWSTLRQLASMNHRPDAGIIALLRQQIASAEERGAKAGEALLRVQLARFLGMSGRPGDHDAEHDELVRARELHLHLGDHQAALTVENLLVLGGRPLPLALESDIQAHAEAFSTDAADPQFRAPACSLLAELYCRQQRWDDADAAAIAALASLRAEDVQSRAALLQVRTRVAAAQGRYPQVYALQSAILEIARRIDVLAGAVGALRQRALALEAMGRLREACVDLVEARALTQRLGDLEGKTLVTLELARLLRTHGDGGLGEYFLVDVLSAFPLVRANREAVDELSSLTAECQDPELADSLRALQYAAVRPQALELELAGLIERRERALNARGIDPADVATWPPLVGQTSSDTGPDRQ
jgi:hypothetical protein